MALPVPAASQPPKLLDRMRNHLRTRHYSIRTETIYVDGARRFILFHGKRHPQEIGAAEVEAFLTLLTMDRQVSASTQNQAKTAILYLSKHLPLLLTASEVRALLMHMQGTRRSLMIGWTYRSTGAWRFYSLIRQRG